MSDKIISNTRKDTVSEKIIDFKGSKPIFIMIGICILLFILIFASRYIFQTDPKTLGELHEENYLKKPSDTNYIYNGFSFIKLKADQRISDEFWYTQYERDGKIYDIPMQYGPKELIDIPIIRLNTTNKTLDKVYISITPDENKSVPYLAQSTYEIAEKVVQVLGIVPEAACSINKTAACSDRPIINCQNTDDAIVIEFFDSPETKVLVHDNCITIMAHDEDYLRASNKLIYHFLKID